jgi:hypothetical protein
MTEGLTDFADKWQEGNPDNPDRRIDSFSLRISTRENIGYGIAKGMFDRLVSAMPSYLVPQNIDGFAIESREAFFGAQSIEAMFANDLPEVAPAQRGHSYVQGVDPALTFDSTWSIVLDVTGGLHWRGVWVDRLSGRQTSLVVAGLALTAHNAYTDHASRITCHTALDATGFGGKMFRRQLLGYKLDDRKLEQDAVMALAVAVDMAKRNSGMSMAQVPFDYFGPQAGGVLSGPDLIARLKAAHDR